MSDWPEHGDTKDGPRFRPKCQKCGERFDWFPEIARRNKIELQAGGQMVGGKVKIRCPKCNALNLLALPKKPGLSGFLR